MVTSAPTKPLRVSCRLFGLLSCPARWLTRRRAFLRSRLSCYRTRPKQEDFPFSLNDIVPPVEAIRLLLSPAIVDERLTDRKTGKIYEDGGPSWALARRFACRGRQACFRP